MSTIDVNDAMLFAALSGAFKPSQAMPTLVPSPDPEDLAMAATRLAEACDTRPLGANDRWLMRTPARHTLLKSLAPSPLAAAVAKRRMSDVDPETEDLLAVLLDEPPLSRMEIQTIIQSRNDRAQLERVILALDRAGEVAPAKDLLQPARAAMADLYRLEKMDRIALRGFVGREPESTRIAEWLSHPIEVPPVTCLFVTGGPGIGKSSLLAEAVRRHYEHHRPLILRLDFDRAGLSVRDQLGLTMEATRQLAEQLETVGSDLLDARLEAGRIERSDEKSTFGLSMILPGPLSEALGKAVATAGRPVLVVLDTLEVLRGQGETHPIILFQWLDSLVTKGVRPMYVLAAGRGDALDSLREIDSRETAGKIIDREPERVMRLELPGLEVDAALAFLADLQAPPQLWNELLELAQGNPLKLRLAAEIAKRSGTEHLPKRKRGSEVSSAFLYRLLLSRIEDPALKRLAHPGLIVRRINADVIRKVLAPTLGLGAITQERANELFNQLETHHWLVERDPGATGYLKHNRDMRTLLLPLLYSSSLKLSARVDAAALRWFAAIEEPWAQVEAVYHQLQLTRVGRPAPSVSSRIASQFDADTLDELPRPAADLVRSTRGERSSQLRGPQVAFDSGFNEASIVQEIMTVLQRQDWGEGAYLVRNIIDAGGLDVRSQAGDAIRTFLWRRGQWAQARRWLTERDRFNDSDNDLDELPEPLALARLEMRAEFDPDGLRRRWPVWRPVLERIVKATESASDNGARHGSLALLLANLPDPFHFPPTMHRDLDLAAAANEIWTGANGDEAKAAVDLGRDRINRAAPEAKHLDGLLSGRVLATLTPYRAFASNLSLMEGHDKLREMAQLAAAAIAKAGGYFGEPQLTSVTWRSNDPIGWLSDIGLFAEWAEATTYVRRDEDLRLIARAAERWRRTMAGDWSIGRRRGNWRALPTLDQTLHKRLLDILEGPDPRWCALRQLDMWAEALASDALLPLLRRRLSSFSAELDSPRVVTRRLLARGVPAVFVPALAVLIVRHEL